MSTAFAELPMNLPKKPKSLQDILKQRQQTTFVGREPQIAMFRHNMERSPEFRDYFIFNVWVRIRVGNITRRLKLPGRTKILPRRQ